MLERGLGELGRGAMSAYQGGDGRRELQLGKNSIRRGPHELTRGAGGTGKAVAPAAEAQNTGWVWDPILGKAV